MDVFDIHRATGLSLRRIRYVLDQRVLPGAEKASKGPRVTRTFTAFEAFGIALAGLMLDGGLRRPFVAKCIAALSRVPPAAASPRASCPLLLAFAGDGPTEFQLGDGVNLRLLTAHPEEPEDSGWFQIATGSRLTSSYRPMVSIGIDVARIRRAIAAIERTKP